MSPPPYSGGRDPAIAGRLSGRVGFVTRERSQRTPGPFPHGPRFAQIPCYHIWTKSENLVSDDSRIVCLYTIVPFFFQYVQILIISYFCYEFPNYKISPNLRFSYNFSYFLTISAKYIAPQSKNIQG